ncbi:hypothetical protein [uncultured Fibrobacter sp.]|uniref:hypothetical protein n=1 Tax=uncultured Fibrobacter sp. TaxID=261512 RepID=UPI0025FFDB2D|nr:hypothetical protein [uncultured Fibrobacter sp.]
MKENLLKLGLATSVACACALFFACGDDDSWTPANPNPEMSSLQEESSSSSENSSSSSSGVEDEKSSSSSKVKSSSSENENSSSSKENSSSSEGNSSSSESSSSGASSSSAEVVGAAITGCKCAAASETVDVAEGGVAAWTVTGCTTQGANITTYTWGGAGVTGEGTSATATLAAKGDVIQPTLVVGNDDNTLQDVTCPAVKAIDSNTPDYVFDKNSAIRGLRFEGNVNTTILFDMPPDWITEENDCSFMCSVERGLNGDGEVSGNLGPYNLKGEDFIQKHILVSLTIGGNTLPFVMNIGDNEGITCYLAK